MAAADPINRNNFSTRERDAMKPGFPMSEVEELEVIYSLDKSHHLSSTT